MKKTLMALAFAGMSLFFVGCNNDKNFYPNYSNNSSKDETIKEQEKESYGSSNDSDKVMGMINGTDESQSNSGTTKSYQEKKSEQLAQNQTEGSSQSELLENLPGHAFKEITFERIDKQRYFDKREFRRYEMAIEQGLQFYDLDMDGRPDLSARFEGRSIFAKMIGTDRNNDGVPENVYLDRNGDGILERKGFYNPGTNSGMLLWSEELEK